MRLVLRVLVSTVLFGFLFTPFAAGAAVQYRPDVLVVKLRPQAAAKARGAATRGTMATGVGSLDLLNNRLNIRSFNRTVPAAVPAPIGSDRYGLSNYFTVELPVGYDVKAAVEVYSADPNVEVAEPDYIVPVDMIPNDPGYSQQWTHNDVLGRDINTQEAWDLEVGDSTVIVGIIDTGVLFSHPDLKADIWVNPGEDLNHNGVVFDSTDINGVDDDGDGYVDDLIGWDFMPFQSGCYAGEDCNGPDNNPTDFAGHGTNLAGIVAASTDNGTGVAGIAGGQRGARRPGVKIMCLRAGYLAADGRGYVIMTACAAAFNYAVNKGASVINCSWGSSGTLIRDAALNAVAHGVVVCKAAGNDNVSDPDILDSTYGVLAVAALDRSGGKAIFSNYGSWVDISAPGVDIYNTYSNFGVATYASPSGTSMASPTVAGVAALLKSHHPWFTKNQIDTLLLNNVNDVYYDNPTFTGLLGTGRLDALKALQVLTTANFSADVTFGEAPLAVTFTNTSPNAPSGPYHYTFGDGGGSYAPDTTYTYTSPGIFSVTFTGSGPSGPHTRIRPDMMVVTRDTIEYKKITLDVGQRGSFAVRLRNTHPMKDITLPFVFTGPSNVSIDSFTGGPRIPGWQVIKAFDYSTNGQIVWRLRPQTNGAPLAAGEGVVGNFWVTCLGGSPGDVKTVDSATLGSGYKLRLLSDWADFQPRFVAGAVSMPTPPTCDCSCHGDPVCDGSTDILDVVTVVAVAFRGSTGTIDPLCPHVGRADFNCDCIVDVIDVVRVVNRAFRGDLTPICNPCVKPCR